MGTINISLSAQRASSGMAPLLVFFDASGTTSTSATYPFIDLFAVWDFGDPGAGSWSYGVNRNKNRAYGLVATHVYDTPGVYTARLKVWDVDGGYATQTVQITVSAFSGTTYYVSSSGGNDLWPGTEAQPFQTFNKGWSMLGPNVSLLFKRGDTWNLDVTGGYYLLLAYGPGIVGAYGSGAKPLFNLSQTNDHQDYERAFITVCRDDWRILDLDARTSGDNWIWASLGFDDTYLAQNALFYRCNCEGFGVCYGGGTGTYLTRLQNPHVNVGFIECRLRNYHICGVYGGGYMFSFVGCDFEAPSPTLGGSHLLRIYQFSKGVLSNNRLIRCGTASDHILKLHGPWTAAGPYYTQYVVVSDNLFLGTIGWPINIGPQSPAGGDPPQNDEPVRNIVFERNRYNSEVDVSQIMILHAEMLVVRNNLIDGTFTGVGYQYFMTIGRGSMTYTAKHIRVYNNTCVGKNAGNEFYFVLIGDPNTNDLIIRNNAGYAPYYTIRAPYIGTCQNLVEDHNAISTAAGDFVDPGNDNYHLAAGSPHIDSGVTTPGVYDDYDLAWRRPRPES